MINLKYVVAALAASLALSGPLPAQDVAESEPSLLEQLRTADPVDAKRLDRQIRMEWSRSGSPTMDLLLKRGRDAMEAGNIDIAIGHLSALTDHAPDFAEGWHSRAQAFFRAEEYGLALHDLEQTLALNPEHFAAMYGLAVVFETLDKPQQAYALYQRILDIYPNHAEAREGLERLEIRVNGTEI
ncbi:tetratricopeptide repeat protein [Pseudooceanicola pacificus]|nr:tetratricopeptide repeat protein [Pseudooceanicola pacificus]